MNISKIKEKINNTLQVYPDNQQLEKMHVKLIIIDVLASLCTSLYMKNLRPSEALAVEIWLV